MSALCVLCALCALLCRWLGEGWFGRDGPDGWGWRRRESLRALSHPRLDDPLLSPPLPSPERSGRGECLLADACERLRVLCSQNCEAQRYDAAVVVERAAELGAKRLLICDPGVCGCGGGVGGGVGWCAGGWRRGALFMPGAATICLLVRWDC